MLFGELYNIQPNLILSNFLSNLIYRILTNIGSHGLSDLKTMSDNSNIWICFEYVYFFPLGFQSLDPASWYPWQFPELH